MPRESVVYKEVKETVTGKKASFTAVWGAIEAHGKKIQELEVKVDFLQKQVKLLEKKSETAPKVA